MDKYNNKTHPRTNMGISRMTIATSGSHLRGQHDVGGRNVGGPRRGRGERSQRSKPSINFDISHRI